MQICQLSMNFEKCKCLDLDQPGISVVRNVTFGVPKL